MFVSGKPALQDDDLDHVVIVLDRKRLVINGALKLLVTVGKFLNVVLRMNNLTGVFARVLPPKLLQSFDG